MSDLRDALMKEFRYVASSNYWHMPTVCGCGIDYVDESCQRITQAFDVSLKVEALAEASPTPELRELLVEELRKEKSDG